MIKCTIAGLNFGFQMQCGSLFNQRLNKYKSDVQPEYEIHSLLEESIDIPSSEIKFKSQFYDLYYEDEHYIQIQKNINTNKAIGRIDYYDSKAMIKVTKENIEEIEYLLTQYIAIWYITSKKNAIMMHASSILYNGYAYFFSAKSGTGKSTHTNIWINITKAIHINDDKNIVILEDNKLIVYGNPWSGKHALDYNIKAELKGIIYLHQAPANQARRIDKTNGFLKMLSQVTRPNIMYDLNKWDTLTNKLLEVKAYELGCTISKEAVLEIKRLLEEDL